MTGKTAKEVKHPSGQDLQRALEFAEQRLELLKPLVRRKPFNDQWVRWSRTTISGIKQHFGEGSDEYRWVTPYYQPVVIMGEESPHRKAARDREQYTERVRDMRNALHSILDKYKALGRSISTAEAPEEITVAKAFISHGGRKPSLAKAEDFLRALGVEPIVVEKRASEGREIHDNVDRYRQLSDFAIVLWTRDIRDAQGDYLASGSVLEESGELRSQFRDRVIYLKEEGVKLPAMSGSLVYEAFTEQNMAPAFQKIVTELHGWGWLKVTPADEGSVGLAVAPAAVETPCSPEEIVLQVEEGVLDWQVGIEESMNSAVAQLKAMTMSLQEMGGKISRSNERLKALQQRGAKATEIRKQVSAAATVMIHFTRDVNRRLPEYHDAWQRFDQNASSLLSAVALTSEDRAGAVETKNQVSAMVSNADGAIASMEGLRQTVRDLRQKRLSRDLNYASELTTDSVAKIIEEVRLSRSIGAKVLTLLDELLRAA